jgi:Protein of unknown function DUF45
VSVDNSVNSSSSTESLHRDPDKYIQELIFGDIFEGVSQKLEKRDKKKVRSPRFYSVSPSTSQAASLSLPENLPQFRVIRSARRKRGISAIRQNGLIEIHIPDKMTRKEEYEIIPEMIGLLLRREAKAKRGNDVLEKRAIELLDEFLPDFHEKPASISWRGMRERWGSCTTVDRTIRISDRLNGAPDFVLNCVLFHELIHLRVADHGEDFYQLLARYPDLARAEAWLEGFEAGIALLPDSPILS